MTHKDIYTKFMIEYDKAGASTSYPSLTEYEVATVLDKAYNALIAQKVTGNNYRRVAMEGDLKSIADLGPLTKSDWRAVDPTTGGANSIAPNVTACQMPDDLLYIIDASMKYDATDTKWPTEVSDATTYNPVDGVTKGRGMPVKLANHSIASKFFSTSSNIPWIKEPICFIEDRNIYVVYDPMNPPVIQDSGTDKSFRITYIRRPNPFVKDLPEPPSGGYVTYFDYSVAGDTHWTGDNSTASPTYADRYNFECNSTVAEELISLAVAFALENVESQRLNSKLNMRGLEA